MTDQLDLFDQPPEPEPEREGQVEAMARAAAGAGEWDCAVIDQAIATLARKGRPFSANDVRPLLPAVRTPAIGARFAAARKRGEIAPVGYTPSTDPGTHGHPIRLWRGKDA